MPPNRYQNQDHAANLEEARRQKKDADKPLSQDLIANEHPSILVRIMNAKEIAYRWKNEMSLNEMSQ